MYKVKKQTSFNANRICCCCYSFSFQIILAVNIRSPEHSLQYKSPGDIEKSDVELDLPDLIDEEWFNRDASNTIQDEITSDAEEKLDEMMFASSFPKKRRKISRLKPIHEKHVIYEKIKSKEQIPQTMKTKQDSSCSTPKTPSKGIDQTVKIQNDNSQKLSKDARQLLQIWNDYFYGRSEIDMPRLFEMGPETTMWPVIVEILPIIRRISFLINCQNNLHDAIIFAQKERGNKSLREYALACKRRYENSIEEL